ncbi:MAG: Sec63 [Sclerophora amabilis]|nr:MAG: Sec63 [Sclerophora amabilis]
MTKSEKVKRYEMMVSGQEILESWFVDQNAEIGLGTIDGVDSAKRWLKGTFLYVRLLRNPNHYKLEGNPEGGDIDERLEQICDRDIGLLRDFKLVSFDRRLACTEFGDAMTRYYVKFETMKVFMHLVEKAKMSEILSAIAHAEEFKDIRLKVGEKSLFKEINKGTGIKFPIKVDVAVPAHKISLIIQSELGGMEFPATEQFQKHRQQYQHDRGTIFRHVQRLIHCIIDCQLQLGDSTAVRNGLELARSFASRVWDNSPLQMKQIDQIGAVAVRRLVAAGITSIESLEATEAHRIEMIMSRNPPFGHKILTKVKEFPKFKISAKVMSNVGDQSNFPLISIPLTVDQIVKVGEPVVVKMKAEVGFLNEKPPISFHKKPIYICFLAERSDGRVLEFRRMPARNLSTSQEIFFTANLGSAGQFISCYVMCHEIGVSMTSSSLSLPYADEMEAGTMEAVDVRPEISPAAFPPAPRKSNNLVTATSGQSSMNTSKPRARVVSENCERGEDSFGDQDFEEKDFEAALADLDFTHIDTFDDLNSKTRKNTLANRNASLRDDDKASDDVYEPIRLKNGNWACNHKCKDKTACKHLCCREGVDRPPKAPRSVNNNGDGTIQKEQSMMPKMVQSKAPVSLGGSNSGIRTVESSVEVIDMSSEKPKNKGKNPSTTTERRKLDRLHASVQRGASISPLQQRQKPSFSYSKGDQPSLSFLNHKKDQGIPEGLSSSDYEDNWVGNLPSPSSSSFWGKQNEGVVASDQLDETSSPKRDKEISSELEEVLVGLDDSVELSSMTDSGRTINPMDLTRNPGNWKLSGQDLGIDWSSSPVRARPPPASSPIHGDGQIVCGDSKRDKELQPELAPTKPPPGWKRSLSPEQSQLEPVSKRSRITTGDRVPPLQPLENLDDSPPNQEDPFEGGRASVPSGWEGIDPAIFAEFGDYVELV